MITQDDNPISRSMARRYAVVGDMVLIPREEYQRLRRALWLALNHLSPIDLLVEMGLLTESEGCGDRLTGIRYTKHDWTPAAHAFAAEMQKEGEGR